MSIEPPFVLSERDRRVISEVERIRHTHGACTAASVAAALKISKTYMSEVMHDMIVSGKLEFTASIPGSLRLTKELFEFLYPPVPVEAGEIRCEHCDWPNKAALTGHMKKHSSLFE